MPKYHVRLNGKKYSPYRGLHKNRLVIYQPVIMELKFVDENGEPISNENLRMSLNGITSYIVTNIDGIYCSEYKDKGALLNCEFSLESNTHATTGPIAIKASWAMETLTIVKQVELSLTRYSKYQTVTATIKGKKYTNDFSNLKVDVGTEITLSVTSSYDHNGEFVLNGTKRISGGTVRILENTVITMTGPYDNSYSGGDN